MKTVGLCSKVLFNAFTSMLEAICLHGNIENLENFMSNLGFGLFEENESVLQKRGLLGKLIRINTLFQLTRWLWVFSGVILPIV